MRINIGRNCPPLLKSCFFLFGSGFLLSCGNDNAQDPIAGKAPTAIITASSSTASVNSAVTISWESTNSNTCIASGAWSGSKPTSGSESFTLVSAAPYNFKLNCYSTDSIINSSSTTASTTVSGYQVWDFVQRGLDLDGEVKYDMSGYSVSLSSDGTVVAIGALYNDGNGSNSGHTRVYAWNGTTWAQRGLDLDGEAADDNSGRSVSLSSDGTVVAIGADRNDANGSNSGHTRIYTWNGTNWVQRGNDIYGEERYDYSGRSVSLSSDGTVVAIGAYDNDGNGSNSGHTRIYAWNGTNWAKRGLDLDGEAAGDYSGRSVSLNSDGTVVAIGQTVMMVMALLVATLGSTPGMAQPGRKGVKTSMVKRQVTIAGIQDQYRSAVMAVLSQLGRTVTMVMAVIAATLESTPGMAQPGYKEVKTSKVKQQMTIAGCQYRLAVMAVLSQLRHPLTMKMAEVVATLESTPGMAQLGRKGVMTSMVKR